MSLLRGLWRRFESRLSETGYHVRWAPPPLLDRDAQFSGVFELCAAHLTLTTGRAVTFVEIGANDGISNDRVFKFARNHGWRGVALEPIPSTYQELVKNYRSIPSVVCINAALGLHDGEATFYEVSDEGQRPDGMVPLHQLSSFRKDVILKHAYLVPDIAGRIRERAVQVISWHTLVERVQSPIDVVVIDAEGYDAEILRAIDFSAHRPSLVHFERRHLSKKDFTDCATLLVRAGYRMSIDDLDATAYRFDGGS